MKRTYFVPLSIVLALLVFAGGATVGTMIAHRARARKWHALFDGLCEVVSESTERRVYPRWAYDLRAYVGEVIPSEAEAAIAIPLESRPKSDDWVEGATREQSEAMIRAQRKEDAVTGATPGADRV